MNKRIIAPNNTLVPICGEKTIFISQILSESGKIVLADACNDVISVRPFKCMFVDHWFV